MIISIEDLKFETIIGILPLEREVPQKVIVDLEIKYDYKDNYLDYGKIVENISFYIKQNKFELIETALNDTCQMLGENFSQINEITMKIRKPDIISNAIVGVKTRKKF